MSIRQTNERGNKNVDKGVLSDNEDGPEEDLQNTVVPGNRSSRQRTQKPPENSTKVQTKPSNDDHANTRKVDEQEESIKPTVSDFSKLGQWPGYLTTPVWILLGILLYHVLYIQSLGTISKEKVKSIIENMYGPIIEEMIKKEIDEFRTSHLNNLERDINTMETNQRDLSTLTNALDGKAREIERNVNGIQPILKQVVEDIEGAKKSITAFQTEARSAIDGNTTQVKSFIEFLNKSVTALNEIHSLLSNQSKQIESNITQLQMRIIKENESTAEKFIIMQRNIENTTKQIENQLATTNKSVTSLKNSVAAADSRLKENLNLTDDVWSLKTKYTETVEPNLFNKGSFSLAFMLLFMLVLITLITQYRLYQRMESANPVQGGRSRNQPNRFQSSIEILSQVPSKPQLEAAVCIISFDEGRQAAHQQLLHSANLPNCRVVTFVVRRHSNIPDLPRCKVYLMCTEFSERHVIIEEQGLGLGDLHRTTYDAVLKLGGQLIILYTRDPGSRRLKDNEVYNKGIYCVTHQEELVELNNLGRFFSVYDTLTTQQKTKLRQTIMDCLQ